MDISKKSGTKILGDLNVTGNINLNGNNISNIIDEKIEQKVEEISKRLDSDKNVDYINIGNLWRFKVYGDELSLEKLDNNEWIQKQSIV